MWTRAELKERAKKDVKRSYWGLVLMSLVMALISGGGSGGGGSSSSGSSGSGSLTDGSGHINWNVVLGVAVVMLVVILVAMAIGIVLGVFVLNPLQIGAQRYFIEATYGEKTISDLKLIAHAFGKPHYMNVVKIMFLKGLYVTLWGFLFIIPGIVKAYEYQMIPYILAENPGLDKDTVFRLSKEMMDGEKMSAFILDWSFIGWVFLSLFTCGILSVLYVSPYINMTKAELYETLKHRASVDYYDHTLGGFSMASAGGMDTPYGNPGAYSANAPVSDSYLTGEDAYRLPDDGGHTDTDSDVYRF